MIKLKSKPGVLNKLRVLKGLSVFDLAKVTDITPQGISLIAAGNRNTRPKTAKAIAQALEVEITELFEVYEG